MTDHICPDCGEECQVIAVDEKFDYAVTHCNGGRPGTHHVPIFYVSYCCETEIEDYEPVGWDEGE